MSNGAAVHEAVRETIKVDMRGEVSFARPIQDAAERVAADRLQRVAKSGICMAVVEDEGGACRLSETVPEQAGNVASQRSALENGTLGGGRSIERDGGTPDHQTVIRTQADA